MNLKYILTTLISKIILLRSFFKPIICPRNIHSCDKTVQIPSSILFCFYLYDLSKSWWRETWNRVSNSNNLVILCTTYYSSTFLCISHDSSNFEWMDLAEDVRVTFSMNCDSRCENVTKIISYNIATISIKKKEREWERLSWENGVHCTK